jgi:hypothetical protein
MNFVPLLLVHLCNTLPAGYVDDRIVAWPREHVDCWSVSSPAAPNASIIKGVSHEFCTPAASSFV